MATAKENNRPKPLGEIQMAPHNVDAEKAVLGTLLLVNTSITDVQGKLDVADFYDPRNREIYNTILELVEDNKPIDNINLIDELNRKGMLDKCGGPGYIATLEQNVISPGNITHHADIVHEKALLRQLIQVSTEISQEAYTESDESENILKRSQDKLFNILTGRVQQEFRSIGDEAAHAIYLDVVRRMESKQEVTGLTTGIPVVDEKTGGLHPSDLLILAARPSVGKTSFALNIAADAAMKRRLDDNGNPYFPGVGIFSLEMSFEQIIQRMVCTQAQIPMDRIRKNNMDRGQVQEFKEWLEKMSQLPIYVNDTPGLDPTEMRLQAQRLKARDPNLSLIVVDYLQLMSIRHGRSESRQQEVSQISRMLKAMARDLNVPVLALSQLSRNIESRRGKDAEPRLSDLRESGAIEQDADVVMFLHRVWRNEPDEEGVIHGPRMSIVDLVIAKQRNGPIGKCRLAFHEEFTRYERMEGELPEEAKQQLSRKR
ncbi:MAG: replicative DNA helicase [Candidatus Sumerlaeia bacterium]